MILIPENTGIYTLMKIRMLNVSRLYLLDFGFVDVMWYVKGLE